MWRWILLSLLVFACVVSAQTVDTLLALEEFNTFLPTGWDTLNLDGVSGSNEWYQWDIGGGEYVAAINFSPTYYSQDWLLTPVFDASASADSVILNYWHDFNHFGGEQGSSYVLVSPDGGTTWPDTIVIYTNWSSSGSETGNMSLHLEGGTLTATTMIAFYYHHFGSNYWYVDKVEVLSFASEPNPPTFDHAPYYRPAMPYTYASLPETVDIDDMTGIANAEVCYDVDSSGSYTCVSMSYIGSDFVTYIGPWAGNIPIQPAWSKVQYYFRATDSYSTPSIGYSDTFELVVQGDYYAFDDVDLDAEAPDTVWIDVSALPGAYTIDDPWSATTDDSLIALPFTFRYWGIDYNSVSVHMACFLRFGSLGSSFDPASNQNFPDPDPTGPNGVIAGMWDEFMATGGVGGDVWVYDGSDTFFAVMYENMAWLPPGGGSFFDVFTMEILLLNPAICDEPGGNGEIIVKYQLIDTESIYDYSTVGVENETGELGMTYLFDGTYDGTAAGILPGRAIKFTSTAPLYGGTGGVVIGWADLTDVLPIGEPGIDINLLPLGLSTTTGAGGRYVYTGVPPGTYITIGTQTGYNYDASPLFEVFEGETTYVDTLYLTLMDYYVEDFEDGSEPGDVIGGGWEWGEYSISSYLGSGTPPTSAHSGTDMWGTVLHDDYDNNANWLLYFPSGPQMINFWHYYDFENGWDGGVIAYAVDNDLSTWYYVTPVDGYDDYVSAWGLDGFTDNSGGWVQDSVDLTGTGATHLGFWFKSDFSVHNYAGWYVDDVLVSQRLDKYGSVDGYVYDAETITTIAGATVFAPADTDLTDSYGYYNLDNVIVGEQTVWATAPGYIPNSADVLVGNGSITRANIPLTPIDITPEGGASWSMSYGESNQFNITICNPSTDTIYIWAELIGDSLMRTIPMAIANPGHDLEHMPYAPPATPENLALRAEKMSSYDFPRSKPVPNTPMSRISTFTSLGASSGYDLPMNTKDALEIVDSIDVSDVPTVSAPWAVGCRGLAVPYDYWVTSMDWGTWESFNVQFGLDKEPTGVFRTTFPFTGFYYTPGDLAYDGRWFWQSIPGMPMLYAWDPNTGDVMDSIWDPTGSEWDTTAIWGVGYDPVEDVFYLGDGDGLLWEVTGKSWTTPGQALAVWMIDIDDIYGVAFDPIRRTVWTTSYWYETLTEWDPNVLDGWLFQKNIIDVPGSNLYGMEVGADRILWVAIEYYMLLTSNVYGFGLPTGYHPVGIGVEPRSVAIPPGECIDIVFYTSDEIVPGEYDMTLGIQVGNSDGIWSDYLHYDVTINISRQLSRGWNLISVPVAANPNNVYVQLSDDIVPFSNDAPNSQIYAWDAEHGLYATPDVFERGRGYYLWSWYDVTHIDVSGVPYYDAFTLTLPYYSGASLPGWHLVGNPVNTQIDWDAIVADMSFSGIYPTYYALTSGGWATYSPGFPAGTGRYIDPYVGFYVLVQPEETGVLPFNDGCMARSKALAKAASPGALPDFTVRLSASSDEQNDLWNYIAVRSGASDDVDLTYDAPTPPAAPGINEIAVLRCDANDLIRDVKAAMYDGDIKSWTIHISGVPTGEDVSITWLTDHIPDGDDGAMGMNQIYAGYTFDLYDPITGEHIDMRETNFYSFTYTGERDLIITVSANALGADNSDKVPARFALYANAPNPFNATTEIRFSLPTKSNVALEVMDVSGRIVSTLIDGEMESGWHSVRWNGTDQNGNALASGVYFYRLRTDAYSETRKMIMVK